MEVRWLLATLVLALLATAVASPPPISNGGGQATQSVGRRRAQPSASVSSASLSSKPFKASRRNSKAKKKRSTDEKALDLLKDATFPSEESVDQIHVALTPSARLAFGEVATGVVRPLMLSVTNTAQSATSASSSSSSSSDALEVRSFDIESDHFHIPAFSPRSLQPGESLSVDIAYLPINTGLALGELFVSTSRGRIEYVLEGHGVESAFEFDSIVDYRVPVGVSLTYPIYMRNPHVGQAIAIAEMYTSGSPFQLELPPALDSPVPSATQTDKHDTLSLMGSRAQWELSPLERREMMRVRVDSRMSPGEHHGFVHIILNTTEAYTLPVDIHVIKSGVIAGTSLLDFGTLTNGEESVTLDVVLVNTGPSPVKILNVTALLEPEQESDIVSVHMGRGGRSVVLMPATMRGGDGIVAIERNPVSSTMPYRLPSWVRSRRVARITFRGARQGTFRGSLIVHTNETVSMQHSQRQKTTGSGSAGGGSSTVPTGSSSSNVNLASTGSLRIPFRATVLHGQVTTSSVNTTLVVQPTINEARQISLSSSMSTQATARVYPPETICPRSRRSRRVWLHNHFDRPVAIVSAHLQSNNATTPGLFTAQSFTPVVVPANQTKSVATLTVDCALASQSDRERTLLARSSTLVFQTNVTDVHVPVATVFGLLSLSLSRPANKSASAAASSVAADQTTTTSSSQPKPLHEELHKKFQKILPQESLPVAQALLNSLPTLDFGCIVAGEHRTRAFNLSNTNPIAVPITRMRVLATSTKVRVMLHRVYQADGTGLEGHLVVNPQAIVRDDIAAANANSAAFTPASSASAPTPTGSKSKHIPSTLPRELFGPDGVPLVYALEDRARNVVSRDLGGMAATNSALLVLGPGHTAHLLLEVESSASEKSIEGFVEVETPLETIFVPFYAKGTVGRAVASPREIDFGNVVPFRLYQHPINVTTTIAEHISITQRRSSHPSFLSWDPHMQTVPLSPPIKAALEPDQLRKQLQNEKLGLEEALLRAVTPVPFGTVDLMYQSRSSMPLAVARVPFNSTFDVLTMSNASLASAQLFEELAELQRVHRVNVAMVETGSHLIEGVVELQTDVVSHVRVRVRANLVPLSLLDLPSQAQADSDEMMAVGTVESDMVDDDTDEDELKMSLLKRAAASLWLAAPIVVDAGVVRVSQSSTVHVPVTNPTSFPLHVKLVSATDLLRVCPNCSKELYNTFVNESRAVRNESYRRVANESPFTVNTAAAAHDVRDKTPGYVTLEPNASHTFVVTFRPTSGGVAREMLLVRNNATLWQPLVVQGTGESGELAFIGADGARIDDALFAFQASHLSGCERLASTGDVQTASTAFIQRQTLVVTNKGNLEVQATGVLLGGVDACATKEQEHVQTLREPQGDRRSPSVSSTTPSTLSHAVFFVDSADLCESWSLGPGESRTFHVTFRPDFSAAHIERSLTIVTAREGPLVTIALHGTIPTEMVDVCARALRPTLSFALSSLALLTSTPVLSLLLVAVLVGYVVHTSGKAQGLGGQGTSKPFIATSAMTTTSAPTVSGTTTSDTATSKGDAEKDPVVESTGQTLSAHREDPEGRSNVEDSIVDDSCVDNAIKDTNSSNALNRKAKKNARLPSAAIPAASIVSIVALQAVEKQRVAPSEEEVVVVSTVSEPARSPLSPTPSRRRKKKGGVATNGASLGTTSPPSPAADAASSVEVAAVSALATSTVTAAAAAAATTTTTTTAKTAGAGIRSAERDANVTAVLSSENVSSTDSGLTSSDACTTSTATERVPERASGGRGNSSVDDEFDTVKLPRRVARRAAPPTSTTTSPTKKNSTKTPSPTQTPSPKKGGAAQSSTSTKTASAMRPPTVSAAALPTAGTTRRAPLLTTASPPPGLSVTNTLPRATLSSGKAATASKQQPQPEDKSSKPLTSPTSRPLPDMDMLRMTRETVGASSSTISSASSTSSSMTSSPSAPARRHHLALETEAERKPVTEIEEVATAVAASLNVNATEFVPTALPSVSPYSPPSPIRRAGAKASSGTAGAATSVDVTSLPPPIGSQLILSRVGVPDGLSSAVGSSGSVAVSPPSSSSSPSAVVALPPLTTPSGGYSPWSSSSTEPPYTSSFFSFGAFKNTDPLPSLEEMSPLSSPPTEDEARVYNPWEVKQFGRILRDLDLESPSSSPPPPPL